MILPPCRIQHCRCAACGRDYNDRPVLRDVSLELAAGETLSVIGPNGAGKSTLLRILATLLRPTAGAVELLGAELPRAAWKVRGRIGYLGHEPLLYRELTSARTSSSTRACRAWRSRTRGSTSCSTAPGLAAA